MNSALTIGEFDYISFDSTKGRVGFKDGKEYPITDEEWQRINPEHKDSGCGECTFVQDKETLFTFFVPRELKERAREDPVFVGNFCLPGHTAHFGFYLFRCPFCRNVCVNNLSSVRRLWCPTCKDFYRLDPVRHRDIIMRGRDISDETLKHYEKKDKAERNRQWPYYLGLGLLLILIIILNYPF